MEELILESAITQDIRVETHNDYRAFILWQTSVAAQHRPAVKSGIVMTAEQLRQLIAAVHPFQPVTGSAPIPETKAGK